MAEPASHLSWRTWAILMADLLFPQRRIHYRGSYASFDAAAAACTGYSDPQIFERVLSATRAVVSGKAAYERDSVTFADPDYHWMLLALLFRLAASGKRVTVMDVGGALGSTYHQHRRWLDEIAGLRWCVVEQPHVAACGRREFATDRLVFYDSVRACTAAEHVTFALYSSVLAYVRDPGDFLTAAREASVPLVLIDQTLVWAEEAAADRYVVQHVPAAIYRAAYPARITSTERLLAPLSGAYRVLHTEAGYATPVVLRRPFQLARYRRFVLECEDFR